MNTKSDIKTLCRGLSALGAFLLVGSLTVMASPGARAQGNGITLNIQNGPIQSVLQQLFKSAGKSYTIDQNVTGNVTVNVNDLSFDQALAAVLGSAYPPLDAPDDGGVYHVEVKPATQPTPAGPNPGRQAQTPTTTLRIRRSSSHPFASTTMMRMTWLCSWLSFPRSPRLRFGCHPTRLFNSRQVALAAVKTAATAAAAVMAAVAALAVA